MERVGDDLRGKVRRRRSTKSTDLAHPTTMTAFLLLLLFLAVPVSPQPTPAPIPAPMSDARALLLFKDSFTNTTALSSWSSTTNADPCDAVARWTGVLCFGGIITGLRLSNMGLGGTVDVSALTPFKGLRSISLAGNSLSGPIPPLGRLAALKSIYLSDNQLSGDIPDALFSEMDHLKKLWLDGNALTGPIPSSLSAAKRLIELRLDRNRFTGPLPDLNITRLRSFNVSGNDLSGPIPVSLARFDASSFLGNPGLCGSQEWLQPCETEATPPAPVPAPVPTPELPPAAAGGKEAEAFIPPQPSTPPTQSSSSGKLVVIIVALFLLALGLLAGLLLVVGRRRKEAEFDTLGVESSAADAMEAAKIVPSPAGSQKRSGSSNKSRSGSGKGGSGSAAKGGGGGGGGAELVMVNEEKGVFGLADLMKAAAEVLGNGGLGSAYKAVMASGVAVVVKRMREMNRVSKEVFDAEMRRYGCLHHRNLLTPLAYSYRKEEKLIIYEFVPKGSLLYVLHGDRGPDHAALNWPTRLRIARGIAAGTAYVHAELASLDVPHGNLKSGNVLLGVDYEPLIVDYGLVGMVNPSEASQALFAYKSPEALQYRHVSAKSDVYCLGIIILELLTGKFPSQYLNNTKGGTDVVQWAASAIADRREAELLDPAIAEGASAGAVAEMTRLLRVGAVCTEVNPEKRPDMREAARMIEEISGEGEGAAAAAAKENYTELTSLSSNGREAAGSAAR